MDGDKDDADMHEMYNMYLWSKALRPATPSIPDEPVVPDDPDVNEVVDLEDLYNPSGKPKPKRKNDEFYEREGRPKRRSSALGWSFRICTALFTVMVIGNAVGSYLRIEINQAIADEADLRTSVKPIYVAPVNVKPPPMLPVDYSAALVLSDVFSKTYFSLGGDSGGFQPLVKIGQVGDSVLKSEVTAQEIAVQPVSGRKSEDAVAPLIAYVRSNTIYAFDPRTEMETQIMVGASNEYGSVQWLTWSPDGNILVYVRHRFGEDRIFRLSMRTGQFTQMFAVNELAAPPKFDPATGRLLIAENRDEKTFMYTVEATCEGDTVCLKTRREFATLSFQIDWLDYHPSATRILLRKRDGKALFLLNAATKNYEVLLDDGDQHRYPSFSPDGKRLLFLSDAATVRLMNLADKTLWRAAFATEAVQFADWMR